MNNSHQRWKDKEAHAEAAKRIEVEEVAIEEITLKPIARQQWVTCTTTGAE